MESTSCLLTLKPSYYTIIVQYAIFNVCWGNNRLPRSGTLARGNTHLLRIYFPRTSGLARGKHPHSHPKSTPPSATGFREPPYKPAWLRETPYTTIGVFPVVSGVCTTKFPARAGIPLQLGGLASTIRTLTNTVGGHKSLYVQRISTALLSRAVDQSPSFSNNTMVTSDHH